MQTNRNRAEGTINIRGRRMSPRRKMELAVSLAKSTEGFCTVVESKIGPTVIGPAAKIEPGREVYAGKMVRVIDIIGEEDGVRFARCEILPRGPERTSGAVYMDGGATQVWDNA